jgi:GTP-binding protein HflX
LRLGGARRWQIDESLDELAALVHAAGGVVVDRIIQERVAPAPAHYFGKGKAEEIGETARRQQANLFVSDDALSPVQERNLAAALGIKVIDRTALILDIFAQRARTSEGKLQVELAQLTYLMPRLVGQWKHLERLGGGIGTRGPGETQLESDRRVIRTRVRQISRDLERVKVHRRVQRGGRRRAGWPVVALVGYTNAGKTTLLNRLTGASLTAADQLFVTLDPAARLVNGDGRPPFVLTDTVGFIRKLPHGLVEAFKATLEEVVQADLLLHVVDVSHPQADEQIAAVNSVLNELGAGDKPTMMVFNKIDRFENRELLKKYQERFPGAVGISAKNGDSGLVAICWFTRPLGYNEGSSLLAEYTGLQAGSSRLRSARLPRSRSPL